LKQLNVAQQASWLMADFTRRGAPARRAAVSTVMRGWALVLALPLLGVLSACGGGGGGGHREGLAAGTTTAGALSTAPDIATSPATATPTLPQAAVAPETRGQLHEVTALGTVTVQQVLAATAQVDVPALTPRYDVDTFRLSYSTVDIDQRPVLASGLLAVPRKAAGARSPVISYQHPTIFHDAQAPSNNPTATEPAVVMAAMGYVVIAADYVGYGVSKGVPHPYLMAAPTAAAVVDLLDAGALHAANAGLLLNGQLFLVGYSQGGHATMAAHRALQARDDAIAAAVVGSAPGAGPLDVGATLDELLRRVRSEVPLLGALINPDLLQYLSTSLRRQLRDEMLQRVLPADSDIVFDGRFLDNFLDNNRAVIRRDSDVHDWRPDRPVRLFHGQDDQTVPFIASANAWQAMNARGAPDVQLTACSAVPSSHLGCVQAYWQHMLSQMALVVRDL
jgi:dienelactone hydrolase